MPKKVKKNVKQKLVTLGKHKPEVKADALSAFMALKELL